MSRWAQILLSAGAAIASAFTAWGALSTRVSATEATIERHGREIDQLKDEQKDARWNLWALCRHVGAPDCRMPGERR